MNFKTLIAHYDSLPKDQLIQKLVDKNALLLKQENEITRLTKEVKDKDEEFKQQCEDVEESLLDLSESKLLENIQNNDNTCIIFHLKTKGKKRGYIEKQEFEVTKPISEINFDEI